MNSAALELDDSMHARLFLRSLLLQACWSFQRMQSLGFAYALDPWLRRCWSREDELREARLRHQDFFNTQPVMASLVLGMICALEQKLAAAPAAERPMRAARLATLKQATAGALAGIGDALFWGGLRPACAALSLAVGMVCVRARRPDLAAVLVPVAYLAAYNIPALGLRWVGLGLGYRWGESIAVRLKDVPWQAWIARLRMAAAVFGLAAFVLMTAAPGKVQRGIGFLALGTGLGALALFPLALNPYRLYGLAAVVGALASAAGFI